MTNTTTALTIEQIEANIQGIEQVIASIKPIRENADQLIMLQQQHAEYKAMHIRATELEPALDETSSAVNNTKGEVTMTKKQVVFNAANLEVLQNASGQIAKALYGMGVTAPLFSSFIGGNAKQLTVDVRRNKFVVLTEEATKETAAVEHSIQFSSKQGKEIINYLTVVVPGLYSKFMDSAEFKALEKMNLKGRLTVKPKKGKNKTRETVLMAALNMDDIYVVSEGEVLGKVRDFSLEELEEQVVSKVEVNGIEKYVVNENIQFYIAKDTRLTNLTSVNSLYQKMSGSLAAYRFAKAKGKKTEVVNVVKEVNVDGMVLRIEEPQRAVVLDEMCTFDGSGSLPFGEEINGAVLKGIFSEVFVVHREDGLLEAGAHVSEEDTFSYKTYAKSMSQARSNGAVGFKTFEDVVFYFLGTGQDDRTYGKTHKIPSETEFVMENGEHVLDENGNKIPKMVPSGYNVMDVAKSYKRFMLAGSNGLKADKGLLSTFSHGHKVEYFAPGERNVIGEIKPAYIVITNNDGEKITIALVDDFFAQISDDQDFLLNVLDENNAFVGVEKFDHWDNPEAIKNLLSRNLTDGQGYHNSRVTGELRTAGVINSFDTFQIRVSNAVKGASLEADFMCELFGADIILTEGMVKSEDILSDIIENGFQLFVVGQRKDGNDGVWVASQATQQMGLTLDELKQGVNSSVSFVKDSIEGKMATDILTMLNAAEEEEESEFAAIDYVRLAQEFGDVLDEQYIKDEIVSLGVKKLNKLLDSKLFIVKARTRYMFSDVFAIYNAARSGRYTVVKEDAVLGTYEVVAPSKNEEGYFLETGEALSVRFPVTITHEIPVVKAVRSEAYEKYVKDGLWQGVTFFDAFSWVVAQQAGADHDGDTSILIFDVVMVNARKRTERELYGRTEILPFIDGYVKYSDGVAVEFAAGCPTYMTEAAKSKVVVADSKEINGFVVKGDKVYFKPLEGPNAEERRKDFIEVFAEMSQRITVDTIETSLIGVIANRAMILTDLLTRAVLTEDQRLRIQIDLISLCTAGRWEIDRPKHGGAYMSMPLMKDLFENFKSLVFEKEDLELTDEAKYNRLVEVKGAYSHIFSPVFKYTDKDSSGQVAGKIRKVLTGFAVSKPQWLASQKDEVGVNNVDSTFELAFTHAEESIISVCEQFKTGHSNSAKNEIRTRILLNMEVNGADAMDYIKFRVGGIYSAYAQKENVRSAAEKEFLTQAEADLKKAGVFRKKNMKSLTKAKKTAKIRANYEAQLTEYKLARDLYKAELRKEMYALAKEISCDVRALVGALYLIVNEAKTNGKAAYRKDGREYRFVASNGFIALPFEVFAEEMSSLIAGKVSETYFVPQDLSFTLLQSSLVSQEATTSSLSSVKVRVLNPIANVANKTVAVNRTVRVAIKPEQQIDSVRPVMYFLKKEAQVTDAMEVTLEDAAYRGFAPTNFSTGIFEIQVSDLTFSSDGKAAVVRCEI